MKTYAKFDDAELIAMVSADDEEAFNELFERYKGILIVHVYHKIGSLDDAGDLIQDLFTSIWLRRSKLPLPMNVSAYLYRAVRNRVIDWYSRKKVRDNYMDSVLLFHQNESPEADELVRFNELSRQIEDEIAKLPPKMQEVFRLSRMHYLTNKEIAERLMLSEHTVKSHIKKALKSLKKKFGDLVVTIYF